MVYLDIGEVITAVLALGIFIIALLEYLRYKTTRAIAREVRKISETMDKFSARLDIPREEDYE